jgi:hypothetical protein
VAPLTLPRVAEIVVVAIVLQRKDTGGGLHTGAAPPKLTNVTNPVLAPIVATAVFEELQVTEVVMI